MSPNAGISQLEARAEDVAAMLKALANSRRLLILCRLAEQGPMSVGAIGDAVGLSQSAVSQHLALMREEGFVTFDRSGQTLNYRIADRRLRALLDSLYRLYCSEEGA